MHRILISLTEVKFKANTCIDYLWYDFNSISEDNWNIFLDLPIGCSNKNALDILFFPSNQSAANKQSHVSHNQRSRSSYYILRSWHLKETQILPRLLRFKTAMLTLNTFPKIRQTVWWKSQVPDTAFCFYRIVMTLIIKICKQKIHPENRDFNYFILQNRPVR